jgi:hypothetical protein
MAKAFNRSDYLVRVGAAAQQVPCRTKIFDGTEPKPSYRRRA